MTSTSSSASLSEKANGIAPPYPATTSSNEGSQKTTKIIVKRSPWKAFEAATIDISDGVENEKITNPFLEEPNQLDLSIQSYKKRMSARIELQKTREERKRQKLNVERERIAIPSVWSWSRRGLNWSRRGFNWRRRGLKLIAWIEKRQ
jgi:hypothetical protein